MATVYQARSQAPSFPEQEGTRLAVTLQEGTWVSDIPHRAEAPPGTPGPRAHGRARRPRGHSRLQRNPPAVGESRTGRAEEALGPRPGD